MWDNRRLPDSELDIMLVVWNAPAAISAPAILEGLERELTASALHSYLKRLTDKGFLSCTKQGKVNSYLPLISREAYRRCEGETVLKKLYNNSLSHFAAALYDGKKLKKEELDELQALLDRLSREDVQ